MAVPKGKTSKQRRNTRSSANSKLAAPALQECPHCHEMKQPHRVCKKCGYYDGKQVVEVADEKKKKA
mgnify:CR=1 FL=1